MRAFLICPVRGHSPEETARLVERLEDEGWEVHWPPRDTNQEDETGLVICAENLDAIRKSDVVFIVWDGKSQGCLFDAGMAFALGKKLRVLEVPDATEGKGFENMFRAWSDGSGTGTDSQGIS